MVQREVCKRSIVVGSPVPSARGRVRGRRLCVGLLCVAVGVVVPMRAEALEFVAGVNVGGIFAGTRPLFAVTPHMGVSWRAESGLLFAVHDMLSVLPASNRDGVGVHNQLAVGVGYAWERGSVSLGPAFSAYFMPACQRSLCGRVAGVAAGGQAQVNAFLAGPLGVSANASLEWMGGASLVLPGGVAAMVVAGPLVRW